MLGFRIADLQIAVETAFTLSSFALVVEVGSEMRERVRERRMNDKSGRATRTLAMGTGTMSHKTKQDTSSLMVCLIVNVCNCLLMYE